MQDVIDYSAVEEFCPTEFPADAKRGDCLEFRTF
jgi:hypothetical protein